MLYKFNDFINEKAGSNKDISSFAKDIFNYIYNKNMFSFTLRNKRQKYFPIENIPKEIVNNKEIESFRIILNFNKYDSSMRTEIIDKEESYSLKLTLKLGVKEELNIGTIEHEINHLYQQTRNIDNDITFKSEKNKDIYNNLTDMKSYYNNYNFRTFNHLIYLSLNEEISARTQQTYIDLKREGTNKENFIEKLKENKNYKISLDLINPVVIEKIKQKNPVKFVSHWKFLLKNYDSLSKDSDYNNFIEKSLYFFSLIHKIKDNYIKYFGPIKKPKVFKKHPNIELMTPNIFYEEISEREAIDFLNKWERIFKKQGNKLKNKLIRLYDNF